MSWWLASIGSFLAVIGAGLGFSDQLEVGASCCFMGALMIYIAAKIGRF